MYYSKKISTPIYYYYYYVFIIDPIDNILQICLYENKIKKTS